MMTFMTKSKATDSLANIRPTATLLGLRTVLGITIPVITAVIAQLAALGVLWRESWFDPVNPFYDLAVRPQDYMLKGDNYESPIGVLITMATLTTTAYIMTYGGLFRNSIFRNYGINVLYALFLSIIFALCL